MKKIIGIIFLVTMFTLNLTSFAEDNVTINAEVIEITENAFVNNGEEVIEKNSASETEGENAWRISVLCQKTDQEQRLFQ